MYVTHLVFVSADYFFAFWGAEKHVSHIVPLRTTRNVHFRIRCLEVTNRERKWNEVKIFIFVMSKLQLCQLEIPIFIYKLMCQISLIKAVSFLFCEFNRVAGWNEDKTIILVRSSIQIPKLKHWFHIQGQRISM
jgi:tricorn protease-like protein